MAASFAGSKSADGRRRRRLATGSDEPASPRAATAPKGGRRKRKDVPELRGSRIPLRKIISKHRWKIWGVGLLLLLPVLGLRVAALHLEEIEARAGTAIARLLDPSDARLARAYSGLLLLAASQLSVVIWWVRSKSPSDFGGRFGIWLWGAAACFVFALCVSTDAHLAFAETVLHFRLVHFPQLGAKNTEALCWLVPAGLFGAALTRGLLSDMRKSPASFLMLVVAVLCWGGGLFLGRESRWSVQVAERELIAPAAVLCGHVCLTISMLLHARFVLFESSAPPAEATATAGRFSLAALLRRLLARKPVEEAGSKSKSGAKRTGKPAAKAARKPATKTGKDAGAEQETEEEQDEDSEEAGSAANTVHSRITSHDQPAPKSAVAGTNPRPDPGKSAQPAAKPEARPQAGGKPTFAVSHSARDDEEDDEDDGDTYGDGPDKNALKGLSKRERRKLQKQWREDQRMGRAA